VENFKGSKSDYREKRWNDMEKEAGYYKKGIFTHFMVYDLRDTWKEEHVEIKE